MRNSDNDQSAFNNEVVVGVWKSRGKSHESPFCTLRHDDLKSHAKTPVGDLEDSCM
jgi:hypothetical protein